MKFIYRIFIGLVLILAVLSILGRVLPPPKPPAAGKLVTLPDGNIINTYEKGVGPDIVLVHGLPGSAQGWVELADALAAKGFHVVRYDRVGYGLSSRRAEDADYSMQASARELDELVKAMGLEHPALVGWSFGGGVVEASQTARDPETPFIVLLAAVGPDMSLEGKKASINTAQEWAMRLPVLGGILTGLDLRRRFADTLPARWVKVQRTMLLQPGAMKTFRKEMAQLAPASLKVSDINTPTLIIHGTKDSMVEYAVGQGLARRIKDSKLVTLDDVDHMLPLSNTDDVAGAIIAFAEEQTH